MADIPETLVLHGLGGSPAGHWQAWLAQELARTKGRQGAVRFPELPSKESPNLLYWLGLLHLEVAAMGVSGTLIAHSLGAYLWLLYASLPNARPLGRVLLVAPPGANEVRASSLIRGHPTHAFDAERTGCAAREILLVGTSKDPYCPQGVCAEYARPLGLAYHELPPEAGHIHTETGYGPWPWVLEWATQDRSQPLQRR